MKRFNYVICSLITILVVMFFAINAKAENKFEVTFPMETGATAFWFPSDGTYALGLAHTVIRVTHTSIPNIQLDADATIAQEINIDKDTLGGLGIKLGYKPSQGKLIGFAFEPSLGITFLNDFTKFKKVEDIFTNYKIAVYGTVLLYRW